MHHSALTALHMLLLAASFLFCSTVAADDVSTVVVTVTSAAPEPTPSNSRSYTSDKTFRHGILNSTNFYRRQHNATALKWNHTMAGYAQRYASQCQWEHSGGPYGENLATGYENVTAAVDGWGNEGEDYDFEDGGFSEETGHFTQLVWKDTTMVGCGRYNCGDGDPSDGSAVGWYVVCEYYPPGNIDGEYQQEVTEGRMDSAAAVWEARGLMALLVGIVVGITLTCI